MLSAMMAVSLSALSANPGKLMVSHSVGEDMLVFIKPRKMATADKEGSANPISYDITLSTQTDTIAITYTLTARNASLQADSTFINNSGGFPNERLYAEPKSRNWIYRLRFKMPSEAFRQTFCSDHDLELKTGNCIFRLPAKKQTKAAEINRTALQMIELNKK